MNNHHHHNIGYNYQIVEFRIQCQVEYGQTVGVMGSLDSLGNWVDSCIMPLTWTDNHIWQGEMLINTNIQQKFECKFVIFHKNSTDNVNQIIEMEKGANRQYNLSNSLQFPNNRNIISQNPTNENNKKFMINEIFGMRRVIFGVYSTPNSIIHITGNIPQFKIPQQLCYEEQFATIATNLLDNTNEYLSLYYQDFFIDMREDMMRYHYQKNFVQIERGIGRYILFNNHISKPFAVQYSDIQPSIFKEDLSCDNITENLSIGTFLNSANDINTLASRGVTAIVNLQTQRDMERKYVNSAELRRLCKSKGILYINAPIRDNDPIDYVKRAPEVLNIIEDLYKANHHIYIHCTAGIGRAPQTAILHLVLHRNFNIHEASQLVFLKRSVSSPNKEAIFSVLQMLSESSSESTSDRSIDDEEDYRKGEEFSLSSSATNFVSSAKLN